jgi:hypothetical protein
MFSRRQTCRGKSQNPVVWIAEVRETETLKPIDKVSPGDCVKKARKRCAVREMKEDPSEPFCRRRLQTAMSCFGQKLRW